MRSFTRQPHTEAYVYFAQQWRAALWAALLPVLFAVNVAAVSLSLLAH